MSDAKLPFLMTEGIKNIALCGYKHIYEEIIEEYADKLKQDFISQMKERFQAYANIKIKSGIESVYAEESLAVKIEVEFKEPELK